MKPIIERMSTPELIVYVSKFMFERGLTDLAGGNVSAKDRDIIYMTPTLAGSAYHWDLDVNDIVVGSFSKIDEMKNHPKFSREGLTHLSIYRSYPFVNAIIHAHPFYVLPFTVKSKPIPPVLNSSKILGTLQYHVEAPAYSQKQADSIVEILSDKQEEMKKKAAAVLMPRHGVIVAGCDLITTLDYLQRINTNAFAVLVQKWIE